MMAVAEDGPTPMSDDETEATGVAIFSTQMQSNDSITASTETETEAHMPEHMADTEAFIVRDQDVEQESHNADMEVEDPDEPHVDTAESAQADDFAETTAFIGDGETIEPNAEHAHEVEVEDTTETTTVNGEGDSLTNTAEESKKNKTAKMMNLKQSVPALKKPKLSHPDDKPESREYSGQSTQLPVSKIKTLMRMDPDVTQIAGDAAFLVTRATELFVQYLAYKANESTSQSKRKTVQLRDIISNIVTGDKLEFLEGNAVGTENV